MSALDSELTSSSSSGPERTGQNTDAAPCQGRIIDVADASRVLECVQVERQLRFQRIVRQYVDISVT